MSAATPPAGRPKTVISDEQAAQILQPFGLRQRGPLQLLLRGTINSNYRIETDEGPLFLRINEGKTDADADFESQLIWHLGSRGVQTPPLWRTRSGQPYVRFRPQRGAESKQAMLFSWVHGIEKTEHEIEPEDARLVGARLAELHLSAARLPAARAGIYTLQRITERLRRVRADAHAVMDLGPVLDALSDEAQRLAAERSPEQQGSLPRGLGHSDLFPDNFLFPRRGDGGWILDLEQAAVVPYVYDVAVALLAFCAPVRCWPSEGPAEAITDADTVTDADAAPAPDAPGTQETGAIGPLQLEQARAFIAGYQALRVLGDADWRALHAEARYAALRFTVTRLTDVSGYGTSRERTGPAAQPANPVTDTHTLTHATAHALTRPPGHSPSHSKDYRDFLERLEKLQAVSATDLVDALR